ncbi:cytochrome P450 [Streptomyces tanashiensis]|uniref:cytochrome P450 n=1 Tax=Streptomyces tanashiensis TaxID=67367 RepID=UPI0036DFE814
MAGTAVDPAFLSAVMTNPAAGVTGRLDLLDLFGDRFVRDPHPALDALRGAAPVHYDPGTGLWLVSRYEDVRRILLDPVTYRPDNAQRAVTPLPVSALRALARAGFTLPPALADNGGPTHAGLRHLVLRFFSAERVAAAVPLMEETATELLAGIQGRLAVGAPGDLAAEYARPLPCRVMMSLLGIEDVSAATLLTWSDAALELFYGRPSAERQTHLAKLVGDFHRWLSDQVDSAAGADGLVGALRRHRLPGGELLDAATAVAVCFFVFVAGQSTTGQLISTVLSRALADREAWGRAAIEDAYAPAWVEEVLRREPPVTTWRRVAAREVALAGVRLPAGAQILLMLMGTGSDPAVFAEPERLCPSRENVRRHLSFGAGRHRCPGATLARSEASVALRVAAKALPDTLLVEDGPPSMLGLLSFRAPMSVPVRRCTHDLGVTAAGRAAPGPRSSDTGSCARCGS